MNLLVSGGTVVDLIFPRVPRLPTFPNHTEFTARNLVLLTHAPIVTLGGNGANAAYAAARCGAAVTLVTDIGGDPLGNLASAWLKQAGCRLLHPQDRKSRTAVNVTAANHRLQRGTFFYPGAPVFLPANIPRCDYFLVCGWPHPPFSSIAQRFRRYHEQGTQTALGIGPLLGQAPSLRQLAEIFQHLQLFLANEHELLAITRTTSLPAAVRHLRQIYAGNAVIKRGPRGAVWLPPQTAERVNCPGLKKRAINTVGAGDSFNGALLAALGRGTEFPMAIAYANAIAASVVQSKEGILGMPRPARP